MTSKADIEAWFNRGVNQGSTHMIVMVDTFDYEDYPVFVNSEEEAHQRCANPGNMQRVMEVYNLSSSKEDQLNEVRSFNF